MKLLFVLLEDVAPLVFGFQVDEVFRVEEALLVSVPSSGRPVWLTTVVTPRKEQRV